MWNRDYMLRSSFARHRIFFLEIFKRWRRSQGAASLLFIRLIFLIFFLLLVSMKFRVWPPNTIWYSSYWKITAYISISLREVGRLYCDSVRNFPSIICFSSSLLLLNLFYHAEKNNRAEIVPHGNTADVEIVWLYFFFI